MNQATTPTATTPAASQRLHAPFQASANVRTRIKICGLTREEDVDAAVAGGADAVGFVLYAPSPRAVTPQRAAQLARRLPPFVTPVLLFVNDVGAALGPIGAGLAMEAWGPNGLFLFLAGAAAVIGLVIANQQRLERAWLVGQASH